MGKFQLLSLFAKKEPTKDATTLELGWTGKSDVVLYRDSECTQMACRWPWFLSNKPRRGQKRVMFNCYQWNLVWAD
jgi:hypothetical protein